MRPKDQPQRAVSARRARQNWLTGCGGAGRRRSNRVALASIGTRHVHKRSACRHWSTDRNRRTHRNRSTHRSTRRHRSTDRNRRTHRKRSTDRNRSTDGRRRDHRNWSRQCHRNPSHVSEWRASRAARARYRRCTNLACGRLEAVVAAGCQRRGHNVRAQCNSDPAQPSPSSNYSDVESIKDRHRHRLLHPHSDIPHPSSAAEPHAVPKSL
jgi:hypothetical protein